MRYPEFDRGTFILEHPLLEACEARGIEFDKRGPEYYAPCPFHKDGSRPNFRVNKDRGVWFCDVCGFGGSVIDFLMRIDGKTVGEVVGLPKTPTATLLLNGNKMPVNGKPAQKKAVVEQVQKEVAAYTYLDEFGELVYQAIRYEPKTFRQRRPDGKGGWIWNMEGVTRVLYNLPKILKSNASHVWICEGEKDCDNLGKLALVATTNVGGAEKWMDAYSEYLKDKEILLCGDNDEKGRKHIEQVSASLAGKVKSLRLIKVPAPHKDISDFLATFSDTEKAFESVCKLIEQSPVLSRGLNIPIQTMDEMEDEYQRYLKMASTKALDLSKWIPQFALYSRPIMPGEVILIVADTGVGKTAILQNIAVACSPLKTILFEMELPGTLTFERFVSMATYRTDKEVESIYKSGDRLAWRETGKLSHISVCQKSRLKPEEIENLINQAELKIGERPAVVLIDYAQLVQGVGSSRYERASFVAEEMKILAKSANVVVIISSQISRKHDDDPEIFLHDAKDSGSLESSAGLALGAWRDPDDDTHLKLKILKNTKGKPTGIIDCNFDGERMLITERTRSSPIQDSDVPNQRKPYNE